MNVGDQKAYSFKAKKGERLKFKTNEDVCVWIYTPSSTLLGEEAFPEDGIYVLQVSPAKGSTSFTLEMTLEHPKQVSSVQRSTIPDSSASKPAESPTIGWIWIGILRDTDAKARAGALLVPSKTQPVTIYPPVVPAIGAQVVTTTSINARSAMPQPPRYNLASKVGIISQGQKLDVRRVDAFVDPEVHTTRVWAEIGLAP